jgi:uncharacterized membrane protein YsdA (DUF1294 family)/cold shock CspA family protein
MRDQGRLIEWFDEKGYGFIQPNDAAQDRVFLHIKDFARPGPRPILGCALEYVTQVDGQGRFRATQVRYLKATQVKGTASAHKVTTQTVSQHPLNWISIGYIIGLALATLLGVLPNGLLLLIIVMNLLTYWFYNEDKRAATENRRRVPEQTLHLLAAAGGWPAAHWAQQKLRHKTQKQPFRQHYFCMIGVNLALLVVLIML